MAAAYQVNVSATDDETFEFTCEWMMQDGDPFPWDDYAIAYALKGCGSSLQFASGDDGIFVDQPNNSVTFRASSDRRLRPGRYDHGCKITHLTTNKTIQIFDGSVQITEGNL